MDYDETFAPVAKPAKFRLMLELAQIYNLCIHQLDVDSAFLYAPLDKYVFIATGHGYRTGTLFEVTKESVWIETNTQKLELTFREVHQELRIRRSI